MCIRDRAYGVGLPAFVGNKILQPAFYAAGHAKLVLKISMVSVLVNLCLSILLMQFFAHAGLALATSISFWIILFWQAFILRRQKKLDFMASSFIAKVLTAAFVMALCLAGAVFLLDGAALGPRLQLVVLVAGGLILYAGCIFTFRIMPKSG